MQSMPGGPRLRSRLRRPGRVLIVGTDSVVSRALQVFLRKEGYETALATEDIDGWGGRASSGAAPARVPGQVRGRLAPAHVAIIASPGSRAQRADLIRRVREHPVTRDASILVLLDAGDDAGGTGGTSADTAVTADASGDVDGSLTWPYRLREVLRKVEELIALRQHAREIPA